MGTTLQCGQFLARYLIFSFLILATSFVSAKQGPAYVPGELIVKFQSEGFRPSQFFSSYQAESTEIFQDKSLELLKFPSVYDVKKVAEELKQDPSVAAVELNYIFELNSMPNDPSLKELRGFHNEGQKRWAKKDADIDMPEAWDIQKGSRDVLVVIVDTGIDYNHEDLVENIWQNPGETGKDSEGRDKSSNGIDDDENGYIDDFRGWNFDKNSNDPMDDNGHGTHVAGTIGAVGDNGIGISGVNQEVSMVAVKVFNNKGQSTSAALLKAMEYVNRLDLDHEVTVVNNSWGGTTSSELMFKLIKQMEEQEIIFVAAAGNNGGDNDIKPIYPSSYDLGHIISVAATTHSNHLASFSNFGLESVDVAAPGQAIYSTILNNEYKAIDGTSMAAPHVTGLVALLKAEFPDESPAELRERVVLTGDPLNRLKGKLIHGSRINAFNALRNHIPLRVDLLRPLKPGKEFFHKVGKPADEKKPEVQ